MQKSLTVEANAQQDEKERIEQLKKMETDRFFYIEKKKNICLHLCDGTYGLLSWLCIIYTPRREAGVVSLKSYQVLIKVIHNEFLLRNLCEKKTRKEGFFSCSLYLCSNFTVRNTKILKTFI